MVRFFFKISDPKQNNISKQCTESQKCSSKITKVIPSQSFHKCGTMNDDERQHQSGKTYSLVEMKFRRDKNIMQNNQLTNKPEIHMVGIFAQNGRAPLARVSIGANEDSPLLRRCHHQLSVRSHNRRDDDRAHTEERQKYFNQHYVLGRSEYFKHYN